MIRVWPLDLEKEKTQTCATITGFPPKEAVSESEWLLSDGTSFCDKAAYGTCSGGINP